MSCPSPLEFSNGFCYSVCPAGFKGQGPLCVANCPEGFVDHGTTCEPESILRKPIKAYMSPCADNQIDRNGDCFEPQTVAWYNKVSGCGCIRQTLSQRLQCPSGYSLYNNSCITNCPEGFHDVRDANGISSLYCIASCPKSKNGVPWQDLNGLCIKDVQSRLPHKSFEGPEGPTDVPIFSSSQSMVSYLASVPLGSSLNSRYRKNYTIFQDLGSGNSTPPGLGSSDPSWDTWTGLLLSPRNLILFVAFFGLILFAGPSLFGAIGQGLGSLVKGLGSLAGAVEEGAGSLVKSTAGAVAGLESAVAKDVSAAIATTGAKLEAKNARRAIDATTEATNELVDAREALKNVSLFQNTTSQD